MKLVITTVALLACMSTLEAQENPVFRQRQPQVWLVDKNPSPKQKRPQAYGDTLRGILVPKNNLVYNMPVVKMDLKQFNMPNVAFTPQYKAVMLERYGRTEPAVKPE